MRGNKLMKMQRYKSLNANLMDSANYGREAFLKAELNMLFVKQVSGKVSERVCFADFDATISSTDESSQGSQCSGHPHG